MDYKSFLSLVKGRYSCRNYLDKEVEDKLIEECLETARIAPSACNKQPWRFVVVKSPEQRKKIFKNGLLPGLKMPWIEKAPIIIAICVKEEIGVHKIAPLISKVKYPLIDAGIAGEHVALAAKAHGLDTCWIGWFVEKKVKSILGIPKGVKVISLLTLGYSADEESKQPEKKSLNEIMSYDKW